MRRTPSLSYALSIDFSHFPACACWTVFRPVLTIALPFQRHYGDGAHWMMMMSVEVCWRVGLGGRWRKISYYPLLGWGRWAIEITFKKKDTLPPTSKRRKLFSISIRKVFPTLGACAFVLPRFWESFFLFLGNKRR